MWKEKTEEYKIKKFKKNLIKFFIWLILLSIGFVYLNQNPAEKTSMTSWISILYQKTKIFVYSIFNNEWNIYQKKIKLENNYNELIKQLQKPNCWNIEELKEIKEKKENLKKLSLEDFKKVQEKYYKFANETYEKIKNKCQ